jgi:hypothetical protein
LLEKRTTVPVLWSVIHQSDQAYSSIYVVRITMSLDDVDYMRKDLTYFVRSPPLFQVTFAPIILSHNLTIHYGIALHLINDYMQWLRWKACFKITFRNPPQAKVTCHTR